MNRVIIIGPGGAGKSYFSKQLAGITNLPLYHLDNIFWKEDRTHISRDEFDKKLLEILEKDEWIIDWYKNKQAWVYHLIEKYKGSKNIVIFKTREEVDSYIESCRSAPL